MSTFAVFALYGVFAAAARRHVAQRPQVVRPYPAGLRGGLPGARRKLVSVER